MCITTLWWCLQLYTDLIWYWEFCSTYSKNCCTKLEFVYLFISVDLCFFIWVFLIFVTLIDMSHFSSRRLWQLVIVLIAQFFRCWRSLYYSTTVGSQQTQIFYRFYCCGLFFCFHTSALNGSSLRFLYCV